MPCSFCSRCKVRDYKSEAMSELNDPRVFFAAERTLLAWNRTSLSLMAFGFVIERFGLFVTILLPQHVCALAARHLVLDGAGFRPAGRMGCRILDRAVSQGAQDFKAD